MQTNFSISEHDDFSINDDCFVFCVNNHVVYLVPVDEINHNHWIVSRNEHNAIALIEHDESEDLNWDSVLNKCENHVLELIG